MSQDSQDADVPTHVSTKAEEVKGDTVHVPVPTAVPECRVYKRRWVILIVFMLFGAISCSSWIQYAIIANIIMRYYSVSSYAVDWTSIIFMIVYIPLIFPAAYLMDKKGLRFTTILGTFITAIGSWIKVLAVDPDRFVLAFVGQTLVGVAQVFLLSIPPHLAAVWFGSNQVATATALAVFGMQLGVALGFLLPPIIIKNHENIDDIGNELNIFCYGMAGLATFVFAVTIMVFKKEPPIAPSVAQAMQRDATQEGFLKSMKTLFSDRGVNLLLIAGGINVGVFNALSTLLNQLILTYFTDGEEFAGRIGVVLVLSGMVGAVTCGLVLDKTQAYKKATIALYASALVGLVAFAYTLSYQSRLVAYATGTLLGFSLGGYLPAGCELAMELTYPAPEGQTAGILLCVCQLLSVLMTLAYSWMMTAIGDVWSNTILCGLLALGTLLTTLIPPNMRRQEALKQRACTELKGQ